MVKKTPTSEAQNPESLDGNSDKGRAVRNFPIYGIEDVLRLPQKIQDENAGRPFKRLLLADALGVGSASKNFRDLLSSSNKYGLTQGNEKSSEIALTALGEQATQTREPAKRLAAIRSAVLLPAIFGQFYDDFDDHRLPSSDMMAKKLAADYAVPVQFADECAKLILDNGRYAEIIRDISGSPHVLLEGQDRGSDPDVAGDSETRSDLAREPESSLLETSVITPTAPVPPEIARPRAIFIGHGKKKGPLEKLQKFLTSFQIPHKIAVDEPNLGRPIPQKVKDTMLQCGSAILIFTCDEKLLDQDGNEIWRPSENVVHELGAASFAYEDRVVIFKERGISFPSNFQSIGYIEFEEDQIEAKTTDLLKELIGFGLVKVTTA